MIKAIRGTRDLLPPETALWNFVEAAVRDVFRVYHFHEIRTPIFEETQLFARSVGEETDIVSKEMYTWEDRGRPASDKGQSLTLRPENTAGVVRAYIEHKLWERGLNKLYYIGPQFRRERPQKGRYRQFYQIGAEIIGPASAGSESPARDAEVLELLATLLDRLGITDWTLQLNSIGCPNDRAKYNDALRAQNAILGGGRHDGLTESLGDPSAPGIGFAIGEDRLVMALKESGETVQRKPDVYVAPLGPGMNRRAARLARELRRDDLITELGDESFRLKKSLETASKIGARFALIVGENEVKSGAFALKNLQSGEQVSVPRAELVQKI